MTKRIRVDNNRTVPIKSVFKDTRGPKTIDPSHPWLCYIENEIADPKSEYAACRFQEEHSRPRFQLKKNAKRFLPLVEQLDKIENQPDYWSSTRTKMEALDYGFQKLMLMTSPESTKEPSMKELNELVCKLQDSVYSTLLDHSDQFKAFRNLCIKVLNLTAE
jgi:hypothetical protein